MPPTMEDADDTAADVATLISFYTAIDCPDFANADKAREIIVLFQQLVRRPQPTPAPPCPLCRHGPRPS